MFIRTLILLVILIPLCWTIDEWFTDGASTSHQTITVEQQLHAILNKAITINGVKTTLGAIYGDIQPTVHNFRPGLTLIQALSSQNEVIISDKLGDIGEMCIGGSYIERKFVPSELNQLKLQNTDTPTAIAMKIAQDISVQTPSVIALVGDVRTGKSISLAKIAYELHKLAPTSWVIRVDLLNYRTPGLDMLTLRKIIEDNVAPQNVDLLHNLLLVNPKKIIILFDNIDYGMGNNGVKLTTLITTLVDRGTRIVMTGRNNNIEILREKFLIDAYKITAMNIYETKQFLERIWMEKALIDNDGFLARNDMQLSIVEIRVRHYVELFAHALFKIALPRQPGTLIILADIFSRIEQGTYSIGCLDYVLSPLPSTLISLTAIEYVRVDKNLIFDTFVEKFQDKSDFIGRHYGVVAFAQIVHNNDELRDIGVEFLQVMSASLKAAENKIIEQLQFTKFINYNPKRGIEFIHPEYQNYFAAQWIVSVLASNNVAWITLLQKLLSCESCIGVLEFVNCQLRNAEPLPLPRFQSYNRYTRIAIFNNIIQHRLEYLFIHIYNNLLETEHEMVKSYFLYARQGMEIPELVFGLTRSLKQHPEPNPFESVVSLQVTCTPLELLVRQNMLHACQMLQSTGIWFINDLQLYQNYYLKLLVIAVEQSIPNVELVKFLIEQTQVPIPPEDLRYLLFHAIDSVGNGCQPVANYLHQHILAAQLNLENLNLLHTVVRWNSVTLLRYAIETLKIPPVETVDALGLRLFDVALDANPSPYFTNDGWWEMMSYLIQTVTPIADYTVESFQIAPLQITAEDTESPWFQLMTCSVVSPNTGIATLREIFLNGQTNSMNNHFLMLKRFIPNTPWRLRPTILSLRRRLVFEQFYNNGISRVSPLEMMIRYRGVNSLPPLLHQHYQDILKNLYKVKRIVLSVASLTNMLTTLCDNIIDVQDIKNLNYFINDDIIKALMKRDRLEIKKTLLIKMKSWQSSSSSSSMGLEQAMSVDKGATINTQMHLEMLRIFHHLSDEYTIEDDVFSCLPRRIKRKVDATTNNCHIFWKDVDNFNDAIERRAITSIRINSNNFLKTLATLEHGNIQKVKQLISLARKLQSIHANTEIITGKSKMVVYDILRHNSLSNFRQNQRKADITNDVALRLENIKSNGLSLYSRTFILYAASGIPIIRGLHATIVRCLQQNNQTNNNNCWYSGGILASTVALTTAGVTSHKFIPWIIDRFSRTALDILPSTGIILRENVKIIRQLGLRFGVKAFGLALSAVGVGFDLYNIVEISKIIDMCTQQNNSCTSRDKIEAFISLNFSCVSIGVTVGLIISGVGLVPGLLIGLGLLVIEEFSQGINDVIYYSQNYDTDFSENFRLFWHRVAFQPAPVDVQALVQRKDWINHFHQYATELLDASNKNIVAYGIGLGTINTGVIKASYSYIDMDISNYKNTKGLSRVLPDSNDNTILLCLPRRDPKQIYDKYEQNVPGAVYQCHNSFVIAHKERWQTRKQNESFIIYDLEFIETGKIAGSNTLNNMFLIHNSTKSLYIIGGNGNITNTFMLRNELFRGVIIFDSQSQRNIIDISAINSTVLYFIWFSQLQTGRIIFGNDDDKAFFNLNIQGNKLSTKLHVVGRIGKSDIFICDYRKNPHTINNDKLSIVIHGGGGQSTTQIDDINDCESTIVQPYTKITGSNNPVATYRTYVPLIRTLTKPNNNNTTVVYATIRPLQSKFIVIFTNYSAIAGGVYRVEYTPSNNSLTWILPWTKTTLMHLTIETYRTTNSTTIQSSNVTANDVKIETTNCAFLDSYYGNIIYPVINLPANHNSTVIVRQFNVFSTVNSSNLYDVFSRYVEIDHSVTHDFSTVTKITYPQTGQTFTFGSNVNDRFFIDGNTTFLFGGDGHDSYTLSRESRKNLWIANEANDNALDTLIIPDTTCDRLYAKIGSLPSACCDSSEYDVTLFCSFEINTNAPNISIVLRNYYLEPRHQHLQIHWRDATYVLLPQYWIEHSNTSDVEFALFLSLGVSWITTALTITSSDKYVVLNITDRVNPLIAYRSEVNDIILAGKYLNHDTSSFIIMKNVFINNTYNISAEWNELRIFIINNINGHAKPMVLTIDDVLNLFIENLVINNNDDSIREYFMDMTNSKNTIQDKNNTIIIDHDQSNTEE